MFPAPVVLLQYLEHYSPREIQRLRGSACALADLSKVDCFHVVVLPPQLPKVNITKRLA